MAGHVLAILFLFAFRAELWIAAGVASRTKGSSPIEEQTGLVAISGNQLEVMAVSRVVRPEKDEVLCASRLRRLRRIFETQTTPGSISGVAAFRVGFRLSISVLWGNLHRNRRITGRQSLA